MTAGKPLCVFVHGWGMNHAIWQPVIESLPPWIESIAVNLPGHGVAADKNFDSLNDLVIALCRDISRPAIWIGWSLGGLAVMQLAVDFPQRVQAMMLVACTPCFVHRDDWPDGMPQSLFDGFALELENDFENTIRRFLALQVKNSAQGRQILKQLRQRVLQQPAANISALRAGLHILKTADLRAQLPDINTPIAVALGGRDHLVNVATSIFYKKIFPCADVQTYLQAAHAPFLSHVQDFSAQLLQLVKTSHDTNT